MSILVERLLKFQFCLEKRISFFVNAAHLLGTGGAHRLPSRAISRKIAPFTRRCYVRLGSRVGRFGNRGLVFTIPFEFHYADVGEGLSRKLQSRKLSLRGIA